MWGVAVVVGTGGDRRVGTVAREGAAMEFTGPGSEFNEATVVGVVLKEAGVVPRGGG